jgi:3',5'-cyclic AMP phosphodiesterase CpdA
VARHLLFQLSDLHLRAEGRLPSGADPLENLDRAIDLIAASPSRPDGVLLTGDLADDGDPVAYGMLAERIDALTSATGTPVICIPGNHDDRLAFGRQLLGTRGDATGPIDQISWFGGLRVISLDSVVPGKDEGHLTDAQLQWLQGELEVAAPDGTIVAVHHPPITSPIRSMTEIALDDPEDLAGVIDGTDVCLVVAGHNHHGSAGMLRKVPVWVGPALSYRSDPLVEDRYVGLLGSAFSRIDVIDGRPLVTFVPVPASAAQKPASP